jgi:hypothetical protein
MRKSIAWVLLVGLVVALAFVPGAQAQAKKDPATNEDRIDGTVTDVNKEKSEISVKQSKTTNLVWTVAYTPATTFSVRNKVATIDKLEKGQKVICLGSFGTEKSRMTATRIDVRD